MGQNKVLLGCPDLKISNVHVLFILTSECSDANSIQWNLSNQDTLK